MTAARPRVWRRGSFSWPFCGVSYVGLPKATKYFGSQVLLLRSRRCEVTVLGWVRKNGEGERWWRFLSLFCCYTVTKKRNNDDYSFARFPLLLRWRARDGVAATTGSDVERRKAGGKAQGKGCSKRTWERQTPGVHDEDENADGRENRLDPEPRRRKSRRKTDKRGKEKRKGEGVRTCMQH